MDWHMEPIDWWIFGGSVMSGLTLYFWSHYY